MYNLNIRSIRPNKYSDPRKRRPRNPQNSTDVKDEQITPNCLQNEDENKMSSICFCQQDICTECRYCASPEKSKMQIHEHSRQSEADDDSDPGLEKCQVHPSHKYLLYCDTCRILVCDLCVNTEHRGHYFSSIGAVMNDLNKYKEKLEKQLSILKHSLKKDEMEFEQWCSSLETEVNKKRSEVKKTLDIVCDELLHRTKRMYKDLVKDYRKEEARNIRQSLWRVLAVQSQSNSDKITFIKKKKNISVIGIHNILPALQLKDTDVKEVTDLIGEFHDATPKHHEDSIDERKESCDGACTSILYNRSSLLSLRNTRFSRTKPRGLPDMPDIILQKPTPDDVKPKSRDSEAEQFTYSAGYVVPYSEILEEIQRRQRERQQSREDNDDTATLTTSSTWRNSSWCSD